MMGRRPAITARISGGIRMRHHTAALEGYRGEIQMELVDGINVMFGNPNDARVEQQPYILLLGRAPVEQLREEMRRWKAKGRGLCGSRGRRAGRHRREDGAGALRRGGRKGTLCVSLHEGSGVGAGGRCGDGRGLQEPVFDKNGDVVFETDEKGRMLLDALGEPVVKTKDVMRRVERVHVTKATRDAVIFEDVDTGSAGIRSRGELGTAEESVPRAGAGDRAGAEPDLHQHDVRDGDAAFAADGLSEDGVQRGSDRELVERGRAGHRRTGASAGAEHLAGGVQLAAGGYVESDLTMIDPAVANSEGTAWARDGWPARQCEAGQSSAIMVLQRNAEVPPENYPGGTA